MPAPSTTKKTSPKAAPVRAVPDAPAPLSDGSVGFFVWDELVAEAHVDLPSFRIKVSDNETLTIPCPSGDAYIKLALAQRAGDVVGIFLNLFPTEELYRRMRELMKEADFPIVDNLCTKVLAHYYPGTGNLDSGESPAS